MPQLRTLPLAVGLSFGLFVSFALYTRPHAFRVYPSHVPASYTNSSSSDPAPDVDPITNATLGFEKVFAVGLAERSDKRDALALISSLTGFKIDWVEGVRGESVVDKALPFGVNRTVLWENNLGSWRSHMNAIRTLVNPLSCFFAGLEI